MGTIRFSLRSDKMLKSGEVPIELVYQISGQRKCYNTGEKVNKINWSKDEQIAIYVEKKEVKKIDSSINFNTLLTETESDKINKNLKKLKDKIEDFEKLYVLQKELYDAEMIINSLKESINPETKKAEPTNLVFDFIDRYIEDNSATRKPGSLSVYRALKNHLKLYESTNKKRITFDKIDMSFFQSFQKFLINLKKTEAGKEVFKLNNTTISKQLSTLKTFLSYAKAQGITVTDKYKDFKIKKDTLEVIALTNSEFELLYNLDLSENERLAKVRDIFCFSCVTGFRYSDLKQLKREHIKEDEIILTVVKTKEILMVPLTHYSRAILAKFEGQYKPLPMISNPKMNVYIKQLCKLAGIDEMIEIVRNRGAKRETTTFHKHELIKMHTGRKTFVTLSLEKGMSTEQVMSCTGHTDYQSFKRYFKVTDKIKKVAMNNAWILPQSANKLKAV